MPDGGSTQSRSLRTWLTRTIASVANGVRRLQRSREGKIPQDGVQYLSCHVQKDLGLTDLSGSWRR